MQEGGGRVLFLFLVSLLRKQRRMDKITDMGTWQINLASWALLRSSCPQEAQDAFPRTGSAAPGAPRHSTLEGESGRQGREAGGAGMWRRRPSVGKRKELTPRSGEGGYLWSPALALGAGG